MSLLYRFCPGISYSYSSRFVQSLNVHLKCKIKIDISYPLSVGFNQLKHTVAKGSVGRERGKDDGFVPFETLMGSRRKQASRSILVQVHSEQSCVELHEYCSNIAPVQTMFHYKLNDSNNFVLVEFVEDCLSEVYGKCTQLEQSQSTPVRSQMLWFRGKRGATSKLKGASSGSAKKLPLQPPAPSPPPLETLTQWLSASTSVSDQMQVLHESQVLGELGTRLRFLTARQVESALTGLFPEASALPFGSSVNGFGKAGCDLDIVLIYDNTRVDSEARLVFQNKGSGGRAQMQRQMEAVADLVQLYLPGCSNVRRILQARVPILKYTQEMTGIDCDLSMTNMTAVYMSELLYIWGSMDSRIRPLVTTVRHWAQSSGLTHPHPGRWVTNFTLILLTVFYLQQAGILPSLEALIKAARAEDVRYADEVNCTFLRDIRSLGPLQGSDKSLEDLLEGFFEFYSSFDFGALGISVVSGLAVPKPDFAALYVVNPLERSLNVSKNVSPEETEALRIQVRNAVWTLDSKSGGLTDLLSVIPTQKDASTLRPTRKSHFHRLFAVKDLFSR